MRTIAAELLSCLNKLQNTRIKPPSIGELHSNEIGILIYLKHNSKINPTISQLSDAFGVTRSSITQQVNRLEALGYVRKQTDENDRRSVFVAITIKGAGIVMKMDRCRQNDIEHLVDFLGEADSKELMRLLSRVAEYNLQKQKQE
ncbi:MAG: winged helix-turn-helix transcriptional regulator [Clostridia bacterium]|nr:winged helix-turn-helix transcriptional regulator [Clostridia bacterium]